MNSKIEVTYNLEMNCIESVISGILDKHAALNSAEKVAKLSEQHNCRRCLTDIRNAELSLSVVDLYQLPPQLVKGNLDQTWKRAILTNELIEEAFFYEDTATNQGLQVKVFVDQEAALKWLQ